MLTKLPPPSWLAYHFGRAGPMLFGGCVDMHGDPLLLSQTLQVRGAALSEDMEAHRLSSRDVSHRNFDVAHRHQQGVLVHHLSLE